jgi:hypothetical protein
MKFAPTADQEEKMPSAQVRGTSARHLDDEEKA